MAMPSLVIKNLVKRLVWAMRGKPKIGASQETDKDVLNVPMYFGPEPQKLGDACSETATGVPERVSGYLSLRTSAEAF